MGANTADVSKTTHDERNRYTVAILQQGRPVVDADFNDFSLSIEKTIRRAAQHGIGNTRANLGFKIVEGSPKANDFLITGGDGTNEGAGRLWNNGHQAILKSDVQYINLGASFEQKSIHARLTGVTFEAGPVETVFTDSSANWAVNEFAGTALGPARAIRPNITSATSHTIVSNTASTIRVAGDQTAGVAIGDRYLVQLTTPTGTRTDHIYMDSYLDEIDSVEDPTNLLHTVGAYIGESFRRKEVTQTIRVREDIANNGDAPVGPFTDADSNVHYYVLLARVTRDSADGDIDEADIDDWFGRVIMSAEQVVISNWTGETGNEFSESVDSGVDIKHVVTMPTGLDSRIGSPGLVLPDGWDPFEGLWIQVFFAMSTAEANDIVLDAHMRALFTTNDLLVSMNSIGATTITPGNTTDLRHMNRKENIFVKDFFFNEANLTGTPTRENPFYFKLERLGTNGGDTHGGDMRVVAVVLRAGKLPLNNFVN